MVFLMVLLISQVRIKLGLFPADFIKSNLSKNVGILIVLHDLNIARKLADNVTLMRDGRTIRQGPTDEVFQEDLLSKTFNTCVKVNDTSPKITFF